MPTSGPRDIAFTNPATAEMAAAISQTHRCIPGHNYFLIIMKTFDTSPTFSSKKNLLSHWVFHNILVWRFPASECLRKKKIKCQIILSVKTYHHTTEKHKQNHRRYLNIIVFFKITNDKRNLGEYYWHKCSIFSRWHRMDQIFLHIILSGATRGHYCSAKPKGSICLLEK